MQVTAKYNRGCVYKTKNMKERIIEIVEIGQPQSLIQRQNAPITELIKNDLLVDELNEQLRLCNVLGQSEQLKPLSVNECSICGCLIDPRLDHCSDCRL